MNVYFFFFFFFFFFFLLWIMMEPYLTHFLECLLSSIWNKNNVIWSIVAVLNKIQTKETHKGNCFYMTWCLAPGSWTVLWPAQSWQIYFLAELMFRAPSLLSESLWRWLPGPEWQISKEEGGVAWSSSWALDIINPFIEGSSISSLVMALLATPQKASSHHASLE